MVEATTIFFVIQFIIFMCCFLFKVYNIINFEDRYDLKTAVMTTIVGLMAFGIGLFTILTDFSNLTYVIMYRFEGFFVVLFILLFFIEVFINIKDMMKPRGRFDRETTS